MATTKAAPQNGTPKKTGIGVDAGGGPVVDPTANVIALSEAANKRQDDLRAKDREISDIRDSHQREMAALRDTHQTATGVQREMYQEKIQHAESGRLDSIRQVDREEVAKTAVAANTAIQTLAKQTNDLASTLAKTVTDTAAAAEARNSAQYADTNKRLSALELSSSEGKGKQQVSDPQIEQLTKLVQELARNQAAGGGRTEGNKETKDEGRANTNTIIAIVGAVLAAVVYFTRAPAPQVVYAPAPPVTAPQPAR